MSITEKENELFIRWSANRPGFIMDGVPDERAYQASEPKIVFVMKEVEDPGEGSGDHREFLRRGASPQPWNHITRWVIGLRQLDEDIAWNLFEDVSVQHRSGTLRSICVMHLIKTPAGHAAQNPGLESTEQEDKKNLNAQFRLYDADLVICCGAATSDIFHSLITFEPSPVWQTTKRGIRFHEYGPQKYVVSYSYPEARVQDCLLYYGLVDAVREMSSR
jgi:hypothetical protein